MFSAPAKPACSGRRRMLETGAGTMLTGLAAIAGSSLERAAQTRGYNPLAFTYDPQLSSPSSSIPAWSWQGRFASGPQRRWREGESRRSHNRRGSFAIRPLPGIEMTERASTTTQNVANCSRPSRPLKKVFQPPAPSLLSLPVGREDEGKQPVFGPSVLRRFCSSVVPGGVSIPC